MDDDDRDAAMKSIYQEDIRIDFEQELQDMVTDLWGAPRNVDWDASTSASDAERSMLMNLATQFHFNNMSELSLCGRILQSEPLLESKMIASLIAVSKIRNIGTWGKYLARVNAVSDVPPPDKEYFGKLRDIDDTCSLLLGMSVIGKVTWIAIVDEFSDVNDPVFQQIIDQIRDQKLSKLGFTKPYLQETINTMTEDDLVNLRRDARYYRGHARETVLFHGKSLRELDKDVQKIADHVETEITDFYHDIGLDI